MSVPETNTPNPAAQYPDERSVPNAWLVRPCEAYNDEYKECTSIKGRFHQYFIEGDNADCSQWKKDFDSCMKFRATKDLVALVIGLTLYLSSRFKRNLSFMSAGRSYQK